MCRERHDGYAIADDPDARAELVDLYIEAEVTRLFALRNHWLSHTNQPRSYEGAQYSLRRKLSGLDMAEKMLRIAGPRVLTKDAKWAPLRGNIEYFMMVIARSGQCRDEAIAHAVRIASGTDGPSTSRRYAQGERHCPSR
jgi:alkylation response protein AidB-like acyl-CoA dehydrogenase